jgi:hypothetical protein
MKATKWKPKRSLRSLMILERFSPSNPAIVSDEDT